MLRGASQPSSQQRQEDDAKSRRLRTQYRKLEETIQRKATDISDLTRDDLNQTLDEANALRAEVARAREGVEDSKCFAVICDKGAEGARKLVSGGRGRTVRDFVRALRAVHAPEHQALEDHEALPAGAFDWRALAAVAAPYLRPAPGASCLLGPLDAAPKVRRAPVRQQRRQVGAVAAPTDLTDADAAATAEIEENRGEMLRALLARGGAGAGVLETVLNHKSFAQTVENIFALSFMVHLAQARLARHPELGLVVYPNMSATGERASNPKERLQVALNYNMADWERWRLVVAPRDTLMAHRPPAPAAAAAAMAAPAARGGAVGPSPRARDAAGAGAERGPFRIRSASLRQLGSGGSGARAKRRRSQQGEASEDEDEEEEGGGG